MKKRMKVVAFILIIIGLSLIGLSLYISSNTHEKNKVVKPSVKDKSDAKKNNKSNSNNDNNVVNNEEIIKLEDNSKDYLSDNMILYLNHILEEDGNNYLANSKNRLSLITIELSSVRKEITDSGQPVAYVDINTFKNKYNEIFGNNYNFEEDIKSNNNMLEMCNNYSSIANKNNICWATNIGKVGPRSYNITNDIKESNSHFIEGKYQKMTSPVEEGSFSIIYNYNGLYTIFLKRK